MRVAAPAQGACSPRREMRLMAPPDHVRNWTHIIRASDPDPNAQPHLSGGWYCYSIPGLNACRVYAKTLTAGSYWLYHI